ncbi:PAS domain S-box protein [Cohnella sp. CBP 2801]|uniref:histidine kinase n=2 Tax=Cohnella zeiphila TaxID=2761120 RepID=A0A7X0VWD9_9BACL|nr:PAS domain S-box protein [Cohnella zeiphila]
MNVIAKQIGATVQSTQQSRQYMEDTAGVMLRSVALAAKDKLSPDIANIDNGQLPALSRELGVDGISLWVRQPNGEIVVARSSDPKELGISSKTWDYWNTAFQQLLDRGSVSIPQGQKLEHFWSGPINYASSDPEHVNKWGYYYDGTTNYIINPIIDAQQFIRFERSSGTDAVIAKIMKENPDILDISGLNPPFFGKEKIIKYKQGMPVYNLDVRDIVFGDYSLPDPNDAEEMNLALRTGQMVSVQKVIAGQSVIRSFIPINADNPYVIEFSFNRDSIQQQLNHQLLIQVVISAVLAAAAIVASYLLAGVMLRPINRILNTVNEIAAGRLDGRIHVRSKDELGLLASRINAMSSSMRHYLSRIQESAEELRSTKQYLESFVNHTSDAIHVSDLQGRVTQVNHAFETMYGWSADEILEMPLRNVPQAYKKEHQEVVGKVLQGGAVADLETVRYAKDGSRIDVSLTVSSIRDEAGKIVAVATISRNITARKQTEEVLRRSEKLSVVGQLAAGVAHEIRNPLTTLRGFVQLLQKQGNLPPTHLEIMLSELDRINYIVSELLIFAKPQADRFRLAPVPVIVRDLALLLESQARLSGIDIVTRFKQPLPEIRCETNQLKQVLLNLMKNGMEAMHEGGTLEVEAEALEDQQGILIRITDHGHGIAEENLPRLGEPFYSTKPTGNGLGLMVSQQIIANHKGSMRFASTLGEGTRVEIRLPIGEPSEESEQNAG